MGPKAPKTSINLIHAKLQPLFVTWAGLLAAWFCPLQSPTGPPSMERLGEDGPGEPADSSSTVRGGYRNCMRYFRAYSYGIG